MDTRPDRRVRPQSTGLAHRAASALAVALLCAAPAAALDLRIDATYTGSTSAESVGTTIPVPDADAAVGPGHFVELLNGRYAVYDKDTGVLVDSSSQVEFWADAGIAGSISQAADPRLLYDAASGRWYAVAIQLAPDATTNDLLLAAVSRSSDPTLGWDAFQIDADPAAVNWLDFSMLGFDADGVYLSVSRQAPGTRSFRGTAIVALPKPDLLAAAPSIARATVMKTTVAQTGFDPQPAVDLDGSGLPLPLLSGNSAIFGLLQASRLEGPVSAPTLTGGILIPVDAAFGPPDAQQPGGKLPLETGGRNNTTLFSGSVVLRNGSLWAAQGIDVDDRAAIRWFEIDPENDIVLQSGVVADAELDLYTPSIAVNEFDQVVIGFSGSSASVFPSAYAVFGERVGGATVFGDLLLLRAGTSDYECLDGRGRNAWGDYSSTVADPTDPQTFWTFQEFVIDTDVWGVSITKLVVPEPGTGALLGIGALLGLALARGRRRSMLLGAGIAVSLAMQASAATLTVDSTRDDLTAGDGECTLREAILNANADSDSTAGDCSAGSGADEIALPSGTYLLTDGSLGIPTSQLTLKGDGHGPTVIEGTGTDRVLLVGSEAWVGLEDLTVTGGRAAGADWGGVGGGILSGGTLRLLRTTISANSARSFGGGLAAAYPGSISLLQSTVSGNWVDSCGCDRYECYGGGGGIALPVPASLALHYSTVGDNPCLDWGGLYPAPEPIFIGIGGAITSEGSVIAGGCFAPEGDRWTSTSLGHNLDSWGSCGFIDPTDLRFVDPLLGPLADNGGPTPTHALLPGSPALDAIPAADCTDDDDDDPGTPEVPLARDQRGAVRPQGAGCDIGAFEATACSDGLDDDGDGQVDTADPGCQAPTSVRENPQCQDGLDNDGATGIDFDGGASLDLDQDGFVDAQFNPATPAVGAADPQCVGAPWKNRERAGTCGLGFELVLLAPLLFRRTRR